MASGAFAGLEQRMYRMLFKRLFEFFMTPQAFAAPCAGLELNFMHRMRRGGRKKRSPDAK